MNCTCWKEINEQLKEQNLELNNGAYIMPGFVFTPTIPTRWLDSSKVPKGQKKRPPAMKATHCPFCGKTIQAEQTPEQVVIKKLRKMVADAKGIQARHQGGDCIWTSSLEELLGRLDPPVKEV
jgi:hypothetical protein